MTVTIYGITTCDTVRKARAWLDGKGVAYRFHDFRKDGLDAKTLGQWLDVVGWEAVLNKAGTSFRALPDADKAGLDRAKAAALILANPTLVKRPVLETGAEVLVGFKPEIYAKALSPG
ncbi:arsenate reductase [Phreatobacter oligotrophus]|uniref:Spx/MgsR family transcriptional regulator n=1 Tax=Phreatobacter oligotrophus TaxID=1122261 RepID=A0A2T4ZIA4_9HYPH|nr:arsenate reductase [Phreatobacter oligotrophus]PTM61718.1 Spx/MgsR family transcriptional regulator [Phreatobacter oligotrophus]